MLVGGAATGKTRASWEAIRAVLPDWRVWHPLTPNRPESLLAELAAGCVGPRTVIWLNEAQLYLMPKSTGERVASVLQQLRHGDGGPILVLGSMWPRYWDQLTDANSTRHAAARELLTSCRTVIVTSDFTSRELADAQHLIAHDDRLKAAVAASDAGITHYLAGGPELLDRYTRSDEFGRAIVHAALDAKRLGQWLSPPADFLREAAPGYLNRSALGKTATADKWFNSTFKTLTRECHGADGILAPRKVLVNGRPSSGYKLADYLEQFLREQYPAIYPPDMFWHAVDRHCKEPAMLMTFAETAERRGRRRRAATCADLAAHEGDPSAARELARFLVAAGDDEGTEQALRETAERNCGDSSRLQRIIELLDARHDPGDTQFFLQVTARSGDSIALVNLAQRWRQAGDHEGAERLAREAADLGDTGALESLVEQWDEAGDHEGAERLAREAADLGDIGALESLGERWDEAGDKKGAERLLREAVNLGDTRALLALANLWDEAGDHEVVERLLRESTNHACAFVLEIFAERWDEAGDHEGAERLAREAAKRGGPAVLRALANRWNSAGDKKGAERLLREAADLGDTGALWRLAELRDLAGDQEGAERLAREAAELGELGALRILARWRNTAGDKMGAERLAREAAEWGELGALEYLATWWSEAGDREGAERLAREVADRGDPTALGALAQELHEAGNREGAERLAREAANRGKPYALIKLREANADHEAAERLACQVGEYYGGLRYLIDLREAAGNHESAELLAREAANHGEPTALLDLAKRCGEAGDHEGAERLAREAANHGDPTALRYLINLREAAGHHRDAERLMRFGLSDDGSDAPPWTLQSIRQTKP